MIGGKFSILKGVRLHAGLSGGNPDFTDVRDLETVNVTLHFTPVGGEGQRGRVSC